jgi:signal transduction histidine kinase/streptogramin lyase
VRFRDDRFTTYTTRDGLPNDYVFSLTVEPDDTLWVGTDVGLARYRDNRFTTFTTADGLVNNTTHAVYRDRAGRIWAGSSEGVSRIDPAGGIAIYTKADGLSENIIDCIFEDREGNIWVGTNNGGLNRLKPRALRRFGRADGLPGENIVPIAQDAQGDIWIGMTCGGLVRYDPAAGTFTTVADLKGTPSSCIWSLLPARDGSVWLGTWGGGLTHRVDGGLTTYTRANSGLVDDAVLALYEDRGGAIWIGTLAGLSRLKDGAFQSWRARDGLVADDVHFITEDRQGAIWIGTSGGVSRLQNGTFTNYTTAQGLSYDQVRAIHETADGAIWIGTYGGGLNRLKSNIFTRYTTRNGLAENVVSRILEDDAGNFWMSGNTGIYRVRRQELDDLADGKTTTITSTAYNVADGPRSNECNGGGQPAGWKLRDGTLWFPTARGVVTIDPRRVTSNPFPPPVVIEQVLVDRRAQEGFDQGIEVRPGASELEIHYTGLSLTSPEQVRFRYRLAPLDDQWIEAGTRRTAYYSHVPPGRYNFTVLASNGDGVWNATGARLMVRFVPAFYQTWWFLVFVTVASASVVLLIYEGRIKRLTRAREAQEEFSRRLIASQEHERKRVAAELHDSLSQTLVVIKNRALLSLETPENPQRALDQMDEIADAVTDAIDEVKEISYNLRPYHLDRLGLTKAIDAMIDKVAATDSVRFTKVLDSVDDVFPKEAEINVYRIVQECVTNIVKHADATEACVTVRRNNGFVDVSIRDNGKGFVPPHGSSEARGFGLIGIAERARLFGGEPQIQSAPGQGTTIHMTLDVHATHATNGTGHGA